MKYLFFFFHLLFFVLGYSQENVNDTTNSRNDIPSLEIIYGNLLYNHQINEQFNSINSYEIGLPIQLIGVSFTNLYIVNGRRLQTLHISYSQIIPKNIRLNDTLDSRINGYVFSLNLASIDLTPNLKFMSTPFGFGFNTGRVKIKSENYKSQKNPFFAPAFFLNPRVLIGKIVLGIRYDYQFDISKTGWRSVVVSKNKDSFPVDNFNQTGFSMNISLGWRLL